MERQGVISSSRLDVGATSGVGVLLGKVEAPTISSESVHASCSYGLALELPVIMDYTVLPSSVTARAWLDDGYRETLLSDADSVLRATSMKNLPWPEHISFQVHADSESVQHFPLPVFKAYFQALSETELLARLRHETLCETALAFFLPVDVIWSAWTDSSYRALLIQNANVALEQKGFRSPKRIVVHENTAERYHLALKEAPYDIGSLSVTEARARYVAMMERAASSQCCASGTCDDIPSRG